MGISEPASMLVSVRLGAEVILMYSSWKGMTDYRMGGWFWLIWFAVLFGPVIFFTVRMSRPPENPGRIPTESQREETVTDQEKKRRPPPGRRKAPERTGGYEPPLSSVPDRAGSGYRPAVI